MKKKHSNMPNFSQYLIDYHKTLELAYHKGYLAGLKESLKTMKEVRDEKKTNI